MSWEFVPDRAIYLQIVERMEREIVAGRYPPGERLPSVRELAAEAGVNPNTMQRALADLEGRGLVAAQRTSGRIIAADGARIRALREQLADREIEAFYEHMATLGYGPEDALARLRKGAET